MDIELLYKKLEGMLTPEEEKRVNVWLEESSRHEYCFKCLVERYTGNRSYSLPALRFELYRKTFLDKLAQKRVYRLHLLRVRRLGYAAGILFVVTLGSLFYFGDDLFYTHVMENRTAMTDSVINSMLTGADEDPKVSNDKVILHTADHKTYTLQQLKEKNVAGAEYDATQGGLSYKVPPAQQEKVKAQELNKLNIQPGAEFCLTLSDGTRVWLNSDTQLKYPSTFKGQKSRKVWLTGEAYFEVAKDPEHPFYVSTGQVDVRVYGTQFNVNTRYRGKIATTLVSGSVAVIPENAREETKLTPGHTAEYNLQTRDMEVNDKDIQLYIGWKSGTYQFEDISLQDFFDEISHWYDIRVIFKDEGIKSESFSGIISRSTSLRKLLDMLEKTNYVGFKISGKTVEIRKKE
mgnify:CR=1 FL=1